MNNIPAVGYVVRKDLYDYLTKATSTSKNLVSLGSVDTDMPDVSQTSPDTTAPGAGSISDDRLTLITQDQPAVRDIIARERTLTSRRSIMSIKGSRNFSSVHKIAISFFLKGGLKIPSKQAAQPAAVSASASATPHKSKSKSSSSSSRQQQASSKIPIIIVPAAPTSNITLQNIHSFLIDTKYSGGATQTTATSSSSSKPDHVIINRAKSSRRAPLTYKVVDAVDKFTSADWDRVVAVFATGHEWQFKGWNGMAPVDIFNKMLGYSVTFNDEPVRECIKSWNVRRLVIHRTRRHLDGQLVFDFWETVDDWISQRMAWMCE